MKKTSICTLVLTTFICLTGVNKALSQRIYWTEPNTGGIYSATLTQGSIVSVTTVATGINTPQFLSLDPARNYIFYTQYGSTGLYRRDYNGTNEVELRDYGAMTGFKEIAYSSNAGGVFGSLIDEENLGGTFVPENYDGTNPPFLPSMPVGPGYDGFEYRGIAVDDGNEYVYWLAIDPQLIVTTDFNGNVLNSISLGAAIGVPENLEYDEGSDKFFFAASSQGTYYLYSINTDGSGLTALASSPTAITSIAVYSPFGKVYYASNDKIFAVNSADGSGLAAMLTRSGSGLYDIDIEADFAAPTVSSFTPANNAANVSTSLTQLTINFNEAIRRVPGSAPVVQDWIRIFANGQAIDTIPKNSPLISTSGSTATINISGLLSQANTYHVLIGNNVFEDMSGNNFAGISVSTDWTFGTQCLSLQPGTPLSNMALCVGGDPAQIMGGTASGGNGTFSYQWESSTTSATSGYSDITNATNQNYDPPAGATVTTYYRRKVYSGTCTPAVSDVITVIVIPQPTISVPPSNLDVCPGGSASFQVEVTPVGSYGYQWQIFDGSDFVNISNSSVYGGTSTSVLSVSDVTGLSGSQYRCAIYYGSICIMYSAAATLTISALPSATDQTPAALCENPPGSGTASFDLTTLNAGVTGGFANRTVEWFSDSDLTNPLATPSNVTVSATIPYYARVTDNVTGCVSASPAEARFAITTAPTAVASPPSPVICSGTATGITLTGATSYAWMVSSNANVTGAVASSGTTINQTLTSTSAVQEEVEYTITPTISGCAGAPLTVTVKVDPAPTAIATPSAPVICSGTSTGVTLSGADSYTWTVSSNTNITGAVGSSGASINQVLTNTSTLQQQIDYTITPEKDGCTGSPLTMTVKVDPSPVAVATPTAPAVCSGSNTGITLSGASSYSWTVSSNPQITGAAASSGSSINQVLTNTSTSAQEIEYTVTPSTSGCVGTPLVVTVQVIPEPVASALPSSPVICSGSSTGITLSGASSYSWTVSTNTNITGAVAGSGSSINQVLTNSTTTSQQVSYSVTPATGSCSGAPLVIPVTVTPKPVVIPSPASETICSGGSTNISLSGGTSYTWTIASSPNVTGASAGSGSSINQTLTNAVVNPQQVNYMVTASANGCAGNPVTVPITVRGAITVFNVSGDGTACEGQTAFVDLSNTQAGISYEIFRDGSSGGTSVAPGGGSFKFPVRMSGTYTVQASNDFGCTNMMNGSATVEFLTAPAGVASISGNPIVCVGGQESYTVTGIESALSYEWEFPGGFARTSEPGASVSFQIEGGQGGLIRVTGVNECGEGSAAEFAVTVLGAPNIQLVMPPTAVAGRSTSFSLDADTDIRSATWNFGDGSEPVAGNEAEHVFLLEGPYTITVDMTVGGGCSVTRSGNIQVAGSFGSASGFSDSNIKNVVTANGDSKNAYLFIEDINDFPDNQVILIDRWGTEVFNVSGYNNNWDLRKNGEFIPAGNYVCIVRLKEYNEVFKRSITVIKAR